jgi:hypothetical protein
MLHLERAELVLHTGYWEFEQVKAFIRNMPSRTPLKSYNHYKMPAPAATFPEKRFESTSCTVIREFIP